MRPSSLIELESPRAHGSRRAIVVASITLLVGLALVGMRPVDANDTALIDVGMAITLLSLIVMIGGIHFYGRLGPQEADERGPIE